MVGHSISGVLASLYAAQFATSGVINIDQTPVVEPFTQLVHSLEARLRGPEFDRTWQEVFAASFHTELLPAPAQQLIANTSRPSRDIVLSYWQTLLDQPAGQIQVNIDASLRELSRRRVPYLLLLGHEPPMALVETLIALMPAMQIETWPGNGHFPHLARPDEFADLVLGLHADRQRHNEAVRGTW
jgi:pimeloyl-ACP methyl ester carboxylesterase